MNIEWFEENREISFNVFNYLRAASLRPVTETTTNVMLLSNFSTTEVKCEFTANTQKCLQNAFKKGTSGEQQAAVFFPE